MHFNFQNALAPAKFSVLAFSRALTKAEQLATYFATFRYFSAAGGKTAFYKLSRSQSQKNVLAWQQNQYCLLG